MVEPRLAKVASRFSLPRKKRIRGRAPLLVLGGGLDQIFPPPDVRATAKAYGVAPQFFPGMAHDLMLDAGWEQVAGSIEGWIEQSVSSR